jgi:hypothetical protein
MSIRSAFFAACRDGDIAAVKHLANDKIFTPACCENFFCRTAFHYVCELGNLDIAKWLYDTWNFRPYVFTAWGNDEVYSVVYKDQLEFAQWMQSLGVSVSKDWLIRAAGSAEGTRIMHWLLKDHVHIADADVMASAVLEACKHGRLETALWLLTLCTPNATRLGDCFVLACKSGCLDLVKHIHGLLVEHSDELMQTAFLVACKWRHVDTVNWLAGLGVAKEVSKETLIRVIAIARYDGKVLELAKALHKWSYMTLQDYHDNYLTITSDNDDFRSWLTEQGYPTSACSTPAAVDMRLDAVACM